MKSKLTLLIFCILVVLCISGCVQKTTTKAEMLSSTYIFPTFDLEATDSYMDVNQVKMTLYFASHDQTQNGRQPHTAYVIYASNTEQHINVYQGIQSDTLSDYRNVDGHSIVAEFTRQEIDGRHQAKVLPSMNLKYKYSCDIQIPKDYLMEEQGYLYFHLYEICENIDNSYEVVHLKYIRISYQTEDNMVKLDFDGYTSEIFRH